MVKLCLLVLGLILAFGGHASADLDSIKLPSEATKVKIFKAWENKDKNQGFYYIVDCKNRLCWMAVEHYPIYSTGTGLGLSYVVCDQLTKIDPIKACLVESLDSTSTD